MVWNAVGIRTLLRRIDFCNASIASELVSVPAEPLAITRAHISDNDPTAGNNGLIVTPQPCAQQMISRVVRGPQLRAMASRSAVSARSSSRVGAQVPFGGCSPVSSAASSFSTFWARTLSVFIGPGTRFG